MMVGRELDRLYSCRKGRPENDGVLEVRNLSGPPGIHNGSFMIRRGAIVGLAGLQSTRRTETARLIIGAEKKTAGQIMLKGIPVKIRHPVDAVANHIGYLSEDRKRLGLI